MDAEDTSAEAEGAASEGAEGLTGDAGTAAPSLGWARQGRSPTVGEAREYFDTHADTGGDPGLMRQCELVLDATRHSIGGPPESGATTPSSFPPAPDDQLEEKGAD